MIAALFCLLAIANTPQSTEDQALQKFYSDIWSPYCKGNSLQECPSGQAEALRQKIREAHARGESFESIRKRLEQEYQKPLRMLPEANFRGKLAYSIPWIALLGIVLALFAYWKTRIRSPEPLNKADNSTLSSELEKEIADRMKG